MEKRRASNKSESMKKFIKNKWVECAARWCLGIIFVYASMHKIVNPAEFAKIIYGYKLLPPELINLIAITLPFIELTCGIALITGLWSRSTAIILNGMLLMFIVAISINLIRGLEFDCGCFSLNKAKQSPAGLLVRDILWFLIGLIVIFYKSDRKFSVTV